MYCSFQVPAKQEEQKKECTFSDSNPHRTLLISRWARVHVRVSGTTFRILTDEYSMGANNSFWLLYCGLQHPVIHWKIVQSLCTVT